MQNPGPAPVYFKQTGTSGTAINLTGPAHGGKPTVSAHIGKTTGLAHGGKPPVSASTSAGKATGPAHGKTTESSSIDPDRAEDVLFDGRVERFKKSLEEKEAEYQEALLKARRVFEHDYADTRKEDVKKAIDGHRRELNSTLRIMKSVRDRSTRLVPTTKTACKKELAKLDSDISDVNAMVNVFNVWIKDPHNCLQDWLSALAALRERGIPMKGTTIAKLTFEGHIKLHMVYNQASTRAPIHTKVLSTFCWAKWGTQN